MIYLELLVFALVALGVIAWVVTSHPHSPRNSDRQRESVSALPPARLPGAGYLHAKNLSDDRLCPTIGGLATVFWSVVDCPACLAEIERQAS